MPGFKWDFMQFDIYDKGDRTNIVSAIHWRCTATEGEKIGVRAGTVVLGPPGETFISFDKLTEEWAKKIVLGQSPDIEKEAVDRMAYAAPVTTSKLPPFVKPAEPPTAPA